MNRRGLSLIEMLLAISITSVIGAAIASMMAAATTSLTSKSDGRQSAIRLATTQVRLGAYIAPSLCILDKGNSTLTLWTEDSRESDTVHASEIRWIRFDSEEKTLNVQFVDFPEEWSETMIDAADVECNSLTNYEALFNGLQSDNLITSIALVDAMETCVFWINTTEPIESTRVCIRFSFTSSFGETNDAMIDESIRMHHSPSEQQ
jgi:prepilin-type N-terminal cleavage/methylation domain-containing protein